MGRTNKHKYKWKRQWRSHYSGIDQFGEPIITQLEMCFEKPNPNQLKLFNNETIHNSESIRLQESEVNGKA